MVLCILKWNSWPTTLSTIKFLVFKRNMATAPLTNYIPCIIVTFECCPSSSSDFQQYLTFATQRFAFGECQSAAKVFDLTKSFTFLINFPFFSFHRRTDRQSILFSEQLLPDVKRNPTKMNLIKMCTNQAKQGISISLTFDRHVKNVLEKLYSLD